VLIEDMALLAENAGLTEWPVVLMGSFDESFLDVPGEVLATAMKAHQKCFSLRKREHLANRFILVAEPRGKGSRQAIVAGNQRVIAGEACRRQVLLRPRPQGDAGRARAEAPRDRLHEKLGTQYERVQRVRVLAREIAKLVAADPTLPSARRSWPRPISQRHGRRVPRNCKG
jgi:glycyl-tRNA synthetase beta chain